MNEATVDEACHHLQDTQSGRSGALFGRLGGPVGGRRVPRKTDMKTDGTGLGVGHGIGSEASSRGKDGPCAIGSSPCLLRRRTHYWE